MRSAATRLGAPRCASAPERSSCVRRLAAVAHPASVPAGLRTNTQRRAPRNKADRCLYLAHQATCHGVLQLGGAARRKRRKRAALAAASPPPRRARRRGGRRGRGARRRRRGDPRVGAAAGRGAEVWHEPVPGVGGAGCGGWVLPPPALHVVQGLLRHPLTHGRHAGGAPRGAGAGGGRWSCGARKGARHWQGQQGLGRPRRLIRAVRPLPLRTRPSSCTALLKPPLPDTLVRPAPPHHSPPPPGHGPDSDVPGDGVGLHAPAAAAAAGHGAAVHGAAHHWMGHQQVVRAVQGEGGPGLALVCARWWCPEAARLFALTARCCPESARCSACAANLPAHDFANTNNPPAGGASAAAWPSAWRWCRACRAARPATSWPTSRAATCH